MGETQEDFLAFVDVTLIKMDSGSVTVHREDSDSDGIVYQVYRVGVGHIETCHVHDGCVDIKEVKARKQLVEYYNDRSGNLLVLRHGQDPYCEKIRHYGWNRMLITL